MTDEAARDNFLKFGNPDGQNRGNFHVSVALPEMLQYKDYQVFILVCFFMVVVVFVPGYFYLELFKEERDLGGVSTTNRALFGKLIDENLMGKVIVGILG